MSVVLTAPDIKGFERDGYVIKRSLLTAGQVAALQDTLVNDVALRRRTDGRRDGDGESVEIALWNEPGEDSFGALARSELLVGAAATLLGGEVYHYHSKLNTKRPGAGGTWVWHQDYGYWYDNGCLFPDLLSVAVALSPMSAANGCLKLLAGSHRAGRVRHLRIGDQTGADPERVAALEDRLNTVAFEAEPGDVMLFHCNVLHTSAPNRSDHSRELLLVAYNARHNDPVKEHHHPGYTPIEMLADEEIEARAGRYDGEQRTFMAPGADV